MSNLQYWNMAIEECGTKNDSYGKDAISQAVRSVSEAANWFNEHDALLSKLADERKVGAIREWADEMRNEMPDHNAWPQEFCNNVADKMDALADLIEETSSTLEIEFVERGNGYPMTGDILINHEDERAYRVLDDIPGTGQGHITTRDPMTGYGNSTILRVEEVDYEEHANDRDAWEI